MNEFITIPTPYVTVEKYAELSGFKLSQVRKMIQDGRIPIKPKRNPKDSVLINVAAMMREAQKQKWRDDQ